MLVRTRQLTPGRSGRLRESFGLTGGRRAPGHASYTMATDLPYAAQVEEGGLVRGEPLLTVPLVPEAFGLAATDVAGLFPLRRRGEAQGYLARRVGRSLRVMYALRFTTRQTGHHMVQRAAAELETRTATDVAERIHKARRA